MEYKIAENIIEITWLYEELDREQILMDWDTISDELSAGGCATSDLLKEDFFEWAKEFESVRFEYPDDYITNIRNFTTRKIMGRYGDKSNGIVEEFMMLEADAQNYDELWKIVEKRGL